MRKVIAGLVAAVALFAGGSAAYESAFCRGYSEGVIDGVASFIGPPPEGHPVYEAVAGRCMAGTANDPAKLSRFGMPRPYNGNHFDMVVDAVKDFVGIEDAPATAGGN